MFAFALTIHKSQGLSLQSAIIDAGSSCFGTGMVYVALSRVTALNGLHLLALDTKKIVCDRKALHEYNSLREKFVPHLGKLLNTDDVDTSEPPTASSDSIRVSPAQHLQPNDAKTANANKDKYEEENDSNNLANATATNPLTTANINIFCHCKVESVSREWQQDTSHRLNLAYHPPVRCCPSQCRLLERLIYNRTQVHTTASRYRVNGDGNCLFRALAFAITGSQNQHNIVRQYIVNHILDHGVQQHQHLQIMQHQGEWGTDEEIIAAAHLFECSVVCVTKINQTNNFCLQHFSPHFLTSPQCTDTCNHETLYLINSTGAHYDVSKVTVNNSQ